MRLLRSVLVERDAAVERDVLGAAGPGFLRRVGDIRTLLDDDVRQEFDGKVTFRGPTHGTVVDHPVAGHMATIAEVLAIAVQRGIEVRFIKGIAASALEPWRSKGRRMTDVDVLVPREQAATLVFALRANGFEPCYKDRPLPLLLKSDRSVDLGRGRHAVDVHWDLDELLLIGPGIDPFTVPAERVRFPGPDDLDVPLLAKPYLLLHIAARLGARHRENRLRAMVDAYAIVKADTATFPRALDICPTALIAARLDLLAHTLAQVDPSMPVPHSAPSGLSWREQLQERLAGPEAPFPHWSTDWTAKFLALSSAGRYSLSFRDACRYVLARKWGLGDGG